MVEEDVNQNTIEDYNRQIWLIKALGITGTGAAIALALQEKQGLIALPEEVGLKPRPRRTAFLLSVYRSTLL